MVFLLELMEISKAKILDLPTFNVDLSAFNQFAIYSRGSLMFTFNWLWICY